MPSNLSKQEKVPILVSKEAAKLVKILLQQKVFAKSAFYGLKQAYLQ